MGNLETITEKLFTIFKDRYSEKNLVGITIKEVKNYFDNYKHTQNWKIEGYDPNELDLQFSKEFTWGHHHDFGSFKMEGRMGNRHINVLATFMDTYEIPFEFFNGKKILDVGCWSGGTTLMLSALGSTVIGLEEVKKQSLIANFLLRIFGVNSNCFVESKSLYDVRYKEKFDIVFFPGVLYHLSDMLVGLRILFNSLKVGGLILIESGGRKIELISSSASPADKNRFILYSGQQRGGFNWFIPTMETIIAMAEDVGFESVVAQHYSATRIICKATKLKNKGIRKAGLSVKDI